MKLSKRLECIANLIEKHVSQQDILADIGTDHGYLPCFLTEKGIIQKAYACDVAIGPLNSSKETIKMMHLEHCVFPLLGNGLEPVMDKQPTVISISGMGGFLMEEILSAHLKDLSSVHTLVLQANICEHVIRQFCCENGWQIVDEDIVQDAHHIYEVIVFKKANKNNASGLDYQFGPFLRKQKPELFIKKWEHELIVKNRVLNSIEDNQHEKYIEVTKEIEIIKEVLYGS